MVKKKTATKAASLSHGAKPRRPSLRTLRRARNGRYASGLEKKIFDDLDKRGIKYEYEPETFRYQRPVRRATCLGCGGGAISIQRRYTPDAKVEGSWYLEVKGKFDSENRSAMEDFLGGSPGIELRFIFQRDNWITSKQKSKYSDWAKKVGVKFHIGEGVPEEWLEGKQ